MVVSLKKTDKKLIVDSSYLFIIVRDGLYMFKFSWEL